MICEAQDSPGYKVTLPTSSKSEPARAALALIAAGFGLSGSPQLANSNAIPNQNTEWRIKFMLLIGCSVTLLDKLFTVPGKLVENFSALMTADENRAALSRQLKLQVFIF